MSEYKTTWGEKLGYGVGAVGLDLSYGLFYSYLSYYLSSVLLLPEAFLLILTPLARISTTLPVRISSFSAASFLVSAILFHYNYILKINL